MVSADQYHVTISRAQVYSSSRSRFFLKLTAIRSRAHVRLACLKHFMIVRKVANASPGLKSIRFITFSSIQMFFLVYFVFIKLKTEHLTAKLQN